MSDPNPVISSESSTQLISDPENNPKGTSIVLILTIEDLIIKQLKDIQHKIDMSRPIILRSLLTGHIVGLISGVLVIIGLLSNGSRTIVFSIIGLLCSVLCLATTFGKGYYRRQKMEEWKTCMAKAAKIDPACAGIELLILVDDFRAKIENLINVLLFGLRAIAIYFLVQMPVEYLRYHLIGEVLIGLIVFGCALDVVGITMSYRTFSLSERPGTHVGNQMGSYIELLSSEMNNRKAQMSKRNSPRSSSNNQV